MRPRHAILLTPLECAVPISILISILSARINSLESALTSRSQLIENTTTLSLLECALMRFSPATPLECAVTKNTGVGGPFLSSCSSSFANHHSPLHSSPFFSHSCALFCAFLYFFAPPKTQLFCFQALPHSLPKTRGWG